MASIPLWLLGKHLVTCTMNPQTVGTAGALTDASTKALVTQMDSFQLQLTANQENINAVNQPRANHVIVEDDFSFDLTLNEVHNASDPDPVLTSFLSNDVFKFTFVKGTQAGSIRTVVLYATRTSHASGVQGKGGQKASASFAAVDTGATSYLTGAVT